MGYPVAVKTVRVATRDNLPKIRKVSTEVGYPGRGLNHSTQRFYREVALWSTLSHPNILKLVGVQVDAKKGQFIAVSEWMTHGNVIDYIQINDANRLELVRGSLSLSHIH